MPERIRKSDAEWRSQLTEEQFRIARQRGTEPPFTGKYNAEKRPGTYTCVCCGQELFSSEAKYESGSAGLVSTSRFAKTASRPKKITNMACAGLKWFAAVATLTWAMSFPMGRALRGCATA